MNQKTTGYIIQMGERGFDRKAEKSERRKRREEQFLRGFPGMQFNQALINMVDGTESEGDISRVAREADKYERVVERFRIKRSNGKGKERVTGVVITIVDFTRRDRL